MGLSGSRAAEGPEGPRPKEQGRGPRRSPRVPPFPGRREGALGVRSLSERAWGPRQKQPLHVLARKGHYDAAHGLLPQLTQRAVNRQVGQPQPHPQQPPALFPEGAGGSCSSPPPQDAGGRTPLFWATEYRHVDLVELLLTHGADVAARDHEGNTCLHWAASVGSAPITRRLLEAGAEADMQNDRGDSPLHLAAREKRYQCLVLLLAHGANVSLVNRAGQTPLQCAWHSSSSWRVRKAFIFLPPSPVEQTLSRDISRGFEQVPIPCLNGVDSEPCPSDFLYVTQDILSDSVALTTTDWIRKQCCQCTGSCSVAKCPCVLRSQRKWYTLDGQLVPTSSSVAETGHIYECHMLCSCSSFCPNRVVQRGIRTQLQLYRTPDKGWGVRTVQDLPRGTFICQYFGELISPTESERREQHTYMYRVETQEEQEYYLDGMNYSGVGRFLNHSCDPNLVPVRVAVGHEVPGIAFFTNRGIQAGEELGFDYGDPYWEWRGPDACKCQSPHCRFRSRASGAAGDPCPLRGCTLGLSPRRRLASRQSSPPCDQPPTEDSPEETGTP
ncbi:histone-lysine N-methyltransferase EHMT1-like [Tiliqua scincoides]|uniref:histone-lysine N-methyltransferase EHMT1-like n=1 Tax=Tiliqua scincoides TaxID=71010 RepID=UPI003461A757